MVEEPGVGALLKRLAVLEGLVAQLQAENAELRRRLGMNSANSSKPPSTDSPFEKPAPKSLRRHSGRKPGGQPGHPGTTLRQVADPEEVIVHEPHACRCCGVGLDGRPVTGITRRQLFDIPPVTVKVSEHRLVERECACGARTRADAPAGVDGPVQYGPRIAAIIVYLYVGQFLSKKRTAQALAELFGTPISHGTVAAITARAADGLTSFLELVCGRIAAAPVAHFDETGLRVDGKLRWVHSASTGKYSLIIVHDKRGTAAMDAAGVLPTFTGVAVHDAWAPYDTYRSARHALCNAHVLRELQAVKDQSPAGQWCWAEQSADALCDMKNLVDTTLAATPTSLTDIDQAALADALHRYRSAVQIGASATTERATKVQAKHHALAKRLITREGDYLRFTIDPQVSFDNNAAEREIRMIKVRQKVSGCLRTITGAEQFCAIRSYLATASKHDIGFFHALTSLAEGHAWMPAA
ncbi:MAG: IS66 family transposase [Jatrophihabitantaceae bacterium]